MKIRNVTLKCYGAVRGLRIRDHRVPGFYWCQYSLHKVCLSAILGKKKKVQINDYGSAVVPEH